MNIPSLILAAVAVGVVAAPIIQQAGAETRDASRAVTAELKIDAAGSFVSDRDGIQTRIAEAAHDLCADAVVRSPLDPRGVRICEREAEAAALAQLNETDGMKIIAGRD
ncbi:hypothetical protein GC169_02285 [bacterium]|nr:hypothetical protein [bacterium]